MSKELIESNIPWIGMYPKSWRIVRFKDYFINHKEIVGENALNYERLALTMMGVIKRNKTDVDGLQPKEFDGYQLINKNDLIFKMIDLQNISTSRVGISPYKGLVSPAYIRFSPKIENPKFIYYYFMSLYYNCVFNNIAGDGVRSALNANDLGIIKCPFPCENEQKLIVEILDYKISKIDALIEIKQSEIEKLNEYKKTLIYEYVTGKKEVDLNDN